MITMSPNYDLLLIIILVLWVLRGVVSIVAGAARVDKPKYDTYNGWDILAGIFALCVAAVVMFV